MLAYVDASAGASGDMLLAALIDAGYPIDELRAVVASLDLADEVSVTTERATVATFIATRLHVETTEGRRRQYGAMTDAIRSSGLTPAVVDRSLATLRRLAEVEARLHGVEIEGLHLHELSGADTLVDVVGFHAACAAMSIDAVHSSALNVGGGTVTFSHGTFAVPAPATAELLRGIPSYGDGDIELVTPTGAAILATTASAFGAQPEMVVERIGYAVGSRASSAARVLRVFIGRR